MGHSFETKAVLTNALRERALRAELVGSPVSHSKVGTAPNRRLESNNRRSSARTRQNGLDSRMQPDEDFGAAPVKITRFPPFIIGRDHAHH